MSRVTDLIRKRPLFWVEETESVAQVVRRMAELNVGAIVVLGDGILRGIFSERDLMTRVVLAGRDPQSTPVERVMSTALATVPEDATPEEAMRLMQAHGCRHLPVMRGREVIGFLSMRDLMSYELECKSEELDQVTAYIHGIA